MPEREGQRTLSICEADGRGGKERDVEDKEGSQNGVVQPSAGGEGKEGENKTDGMKVVEVLLALAAAAVSGFRRLRVRQALVPLFRVDEEEESVRRCREGEKRGNKRTPL